MILRRECKSGSPGFILSVDSKVGSVLLSRCLQQKSGRLQVKATDGRLSGGDMFEKTIREHDRT